MPGAHADDLLRSASWRADKLLKRRGHFNTVLWLTEDANGRGQWFESPCVNAPDAATDAELLTALAADTGLEFAAKGVVRFAVAYLANRVTVIRPVDPHAPMQPKTTKRQGVVIELHSAADEHVGIFREIIRLSGRAPMLAAAEIFDGPFTDSPYAKVLDESACNAAMDQLLGTTACGATSSR
jgi:hypothetical protein